MKRILIYFAMAATATGQVVNITNQQERASLPAGAVTLGDTVYVNPSFTQLQPLGWRYQNAITNPGPGYVVLGRTWVDADGVNATAILTTRTTNEQAQIDADNEAANAAAAAAMPPPEFPRGIAFPDISATNPVFGVGIDNGDLITWVAHASPFDPAANVSNRTAAISARRQIKTALKAIKAAITNTIANVNTNAAFTNPQQKILKDILQELQDLRKAQADSLKESSP